MDSWDIIEKLNNEYFDLQKEKEKVEDYFIKQMKKMYYDHCIKYIYLSAQLIKERLPDIIEDHHEDDGDLEEIIKQHSFSPKNFIEEIKEWNKIGWEEIYQLGITDELKK